MTISRRGFLAAAGCAATAHLTTTAPLAAATPLRVASVKYGSLAWLLETIKAEGIAKKHGLDFEIVEVASNQAGPVSLLSGGADVIVSDWPWAMRQRGLGEMVRFRPFSSALGSVMVPGDSPLKELADLKGKVLGVAGSSIDKSWLLLRAYSTKTLGSDISGLAEIQFGAPPLVTEQIKGGRVDAVLNFWTYSARLEGQGYRRLLNMKDVLEKLGIAPVPPLVGFVWKDEFAKSRGADLAAFLAAIDEGNALLSTSDAAFTKLKPLMKVVSDSEFNALMAGYRSGIPAPWTEAETRSAEKFMAVLIEAGDQELVGHGTKFDANLFHAEG